LVFAKYTGVFRGDFSGGGRGFCYIGRSFHGGIFWKKGIFHEGVPDFPALLK